ncbi:MAG: hypothetical protein HYV26_07665 [Candidatus Hydrogenedentes bacterium]|nr:hypothetical protein [Candidatus Hydrogenedentota bacterium]
MREHILILVSILVLSAAGAVEVGVAVDPVTRYFRVSYPVPVEAGDEVNVLCAWAPHVEEVEGVAGVERVWRPAKVMPNVSETALRLVRAPEWGAWLEGRLVERRAAGLTRTVVFNPYPDAQAEGMVDVDFRISVESQDKRPLAEYGVRLQADNRDVVYIEDWTQVITRDAVTQEGKEHLWQWQTNASAEDCATFGNMLYVPPNEPHPLPPLAHALDLCGMYAIFVYAWSKHGGIDLRLTGDEKSDPLSSPKPYQEVLWRWARLDHQGLVLELPYDYTGWVAGHVDYVKLVPLRAETVAALEAVYQYPQDKFVAGYFEPYSWAFIEPVFRTLQHREWLVPYAEAGISLVDIQIGRFGMKVVYESELTDQLLYSTIGDPVPGDVQPHTDNVGRMQQYTNTLNAELRYCRELGLKASANFGASACYLGTPLQGDISKQHPDWLRGHALRFEVPEVRAYVLSLYREALELGAESISIDFCRYPETIDNAETCNTALAAIRALADEFSAQRGQRVPLLVRFPGTGVRQYEMFDYARWAHEGWVDYLCPSNIQGRHHHIDMAPYAEAVKGTNTALLPCVDALTWGLEFPGPYLQRVQALYDLGVPGIYVYQADGRLLGRPGDRRAMRLLTRGGSVRAYLAEEERQRPERSKGIYLSIPSDPGPEYHSWERLRVWTEGVAPGPMEFYLDGALAHRCEGPPYLLGSEDYRDDAILPAGEHSLRIQVQDGDGWLAQTFTVIGAG